MNDEIVFSETQRFKQWWLWTILIAINVQFLYIILRQVIGGQPVGDNPMSNTGLIIVESITMLSTISFYFFRLETQISKEGIRVRFFPFHLSFKTFTWDEILKSYVRVYHPIREYGGWGVRLGLFGKGKAYNVSGIIGLQLQFNDDRKLLIGTNKAEELTEALKKLRRYKE
jgi:4-amino-4-deoxy-L-arabinose transferase-like glycosyltransferase